MKKFIIILFTLQISTINLFNGGIIGEMFKIPSLVEHYLEHSQSEHPLNFFEFFAIHYACNTIIDEDYNEDMQLPFKSLQASFSSLDFWMPNTYNYSVGSIQHETSVLVIPPADGGELHSFNGDTWNPPKLS